MEGEDGDALYNNGIHADMGHFDQLHATKLTQIGPLQGLDIIPRR